MEEPQEIDLLVGDGYVLTMDEAMTSYYPGSVAVNDGRILAVGPSGTIDHAFRPRRVLHARGQVVLPGLVNGHTHLAMGFLRGMADDQRLYDWLKVVHPVITNASDTECYLASLVGQIESIRGGVTAVADSQRALPMTAKAVEQTGMRAMLAPSTLDFGDTSLDQVLLDENVACYEQFNGRADGRIRVQFDLHAPYSCSKELLRGVRRLADEYQTEIQFHLAETQDESKEIFERSGLSPTRYCDELGILGPDVLAAHFIWVDDQDIEIAAQRGLRVAHNPASNLKLAAGFCPLSRLLQAGIRVGLGTDSCVSNNRLDMFETMKLTALLHKGREMDASTVPAATVLSLATRIGAEAIGLGAEIGSLEPGKRADLILVDFENVSHLVPYDFDLPANVISHLVYACQPRDVRHVVIDGKLVMEDRALQTVDEAEILHEAQGVFRHLLARSGLCRV